MLFLFANFVYPNFCLTDKVQQNLMVTRQNSELLSFMSDISDDPAPNGPNLTGSLELLRSDRNCTLCISV